MSQPHTHITLAQQYLCSDLKAAIAYERQHAGLGAAHSIPQGSPHRPAYRAVLQLHLKPAQQQLQLRYRSQTCTAAAAAEKQPSEQGVLDNPSKQTAQRWPMQ